MFLFRDFMYLIMNEVWPLFVLDLVKALFYIMYCDGGFSDEGAGPSNAQEGEAKDDFDRDYKEDPEADPIDESIGDN